MVGRYRAAQALAAGAAATSDEMVAAVARLPDRYARDMVRQVLAERRA